jgi:hypothetical protein
MIALAVGDSPLPRFLVARCPNPRFRLEIARDGLAVLVVDYTAGRMAEVISQLGAKGGLDHPARELGEQAARPGDLLRLKTLQGLLKLSFRQQAGEAVNDLLGRALNLPREQGCPPGPQRRARSATSPYGLRGYAGTAFKPFVRSPRTTHRTSDRPPADFDPAALFPLPSPTRGINHLARSNPGPLGSTLNLKVVGSNPTRPTFVSLEDMNARSSSLNRVAGKHRAMAGLDPSIAKDGDPDQSAESLLEGDGADAGELTRLLDSIPGAWNRAELGRIQGAAGQTVRAYRAYPASQDTALDSAARWS